MKEIISIHIGQAGSQVGRLCWELYCLEHDIDPTGYKIWQPNEKENEPWTAFFSETAQRFISRSIFVDLEPTVIDEIKTGKYRLLFDPQNLISGKEDSGNCFARGRYNAAGKDIIEQCLQRVSALANNCDNLQGFMVFNAVGGGTGSGLGSLLLELLSLEYEKKSKLAFAIHPSPQLSPVIVEPYNTVLSTHYLIEHTDLVVPFDNDAIYDICHYQLQIKMPTYTNLNHLISQVISSLTSSLRFNTDISINSDLAQFQTNLVPYPRTHFMLSSYSPMFSKQNASYTSITSPALVQSVFRAGSMMMSCNPGEGKYMGCCLQFHGDIFRTSVDSGIAEMEKTGTIKFVDWCPPDIKRGINNHYLVVAPGADITLRSRALSMICNNTAISQAFSYMKKKFDAMYSKKAFLHWYIREGMEEGEFSEAREDLVALMKDYEEAETKAPNEAAGDDN